MTDKETLTRIAQILNNVEVEGDGSILEEIASVLVSEGYLKVETQTVYDDITGEVDIEWDEYKTKVSD